MDRGFVAAIERNKSGEVAALYDIEPATRQLAQQNMRQAAIYESPEPTFRIPE